MTTIICTVIAFVAGYAFAKMVTFAPTVHAKLDAVVAELEDLKNIFTGTPKA